MTSSKSEKIISIRNNLIISGGKNNYLAIFKGPKQLNLVILITGGGLMLEKSFKKCCSGQLMSKAITWLAMYRTGARNSLEL